jgi:N-methylhydantoinase B
MSAPFDAVSLQILWRRMISAVDEASVALVRVAFSTVVRESHDFACVITDECGRLLAQATASIPSFIGTLPRTVEFFLDTFGKENLQPGDVLVCNDPWQGTGHLSDINLAKPIFNNGKIVGFAASTAHAPDIGGRSGSMAIRDVFEEGFQIPPLKLIARGEVDNTLISLVRANVRAPDEVVGDLFAQIAGLDVIEKRVLGLMNEYGLDNLSALASEIHDRSEVAMRAAIATIPAGTYRFSVSPDGLDAPLTITVALTFQNSECHVNFENVSAQISGAALNSVLAYTSAYTSYGLKCILAPEVPNNDGVWRPISISAPKGSILNHVYPTSGYWRHMLGHHLPVAVIAAMADAIPDRVIAPSGSAPTWDIVHSGLTKEGRPYTNVLFFAAGMGGSNRADGQNALSWPSNIAGVAVEYVERIAPFRVLYKALREGSGGAGKFRGGLGLEVAMQVTETTPLTVGVAVDRLRKGADGVRGGQPGARGEFLINGTPADPNVNHRMQTGDIIAIRTPGGGGFGDPAERSAALVERDRIEGYCA